MFKRYREIQERRKAEEASEQGFTLIELLIVIVVLGILAAIVIFSLGRDRSEPGCRVHLRRQDGRDRGRTPTTRPTPRTRSGTGDRSTDRHGELWFVPAVVAELNTAYHVQPRLGDHNTVDVTTATR